MKCKCKLTILFSNRPMLWEVGSCRPYNYNTLHSSWAFGTTLASELYLKKDCDVACFADLGYNS